MSPFHWLAFFLGIIVYELYRKMTKGSW